MLTVDTREMFQGWLFSGFLERSRNMAVDMHSETEETTIDDKGTLCAFRKRCDTTKQSHADRATVWRENEQPDDNSGAMMKHGSGQFSGGVRWRCIPGTNHRVGIHNILRSAARKESSLSREIKT